MPGGLRDDDVDVRSPHPGAPVALGTVAADLYADLRLPTMLRRLLRHSTSMLGAVAGSVSLIDPRAGRYAKMAEHGASCQLGRSFPLDEGVTGQVAAGRRPVVLRSYSEVPHGHLPVAHPASRGAVVAVPIWWRGEVIGATVVFAGTDRRFAAREVDELELVSQLAAAGIVRAGERDPSLVHLVPERPGPPLQRAVGSEPGGRAQPPDADVDVDARLAGPGAPRSEPGRCTPRELEVLELLARGLTDRELASLLAISPRTAEKHVAALLRKTESATRTAAVMRALDRGWFAGTAEQMGDPPHAERRGAPLPSPRRRPLS